MPHLQWSNGPDATMVHSLVGCWQQGFQKDVSGASTSHFLLGSSPQPKEVEFFFIFHCFFNLYQHYSCEEADLVQSEARIHRAESAHGYSTFKAKLR